MSANRQNTARPPVLPPAGPLVCVVTAIREVSPKIAGTWQALRGQTLPWFEWVVMAPGPLWEPVSELCEGDERLRFLQPLVGESSLAEWAAGEETGAPVVVLLDESGHIEPQYLEYVTLALLLEREFSLCCTGTAGQAPPESGTTKWEKSVFAGITAIALRREWLAAEDVPRGRLLYLPLFLCTCAKKPQTLFWQGWFEREAPDLEIVRFPEDAQLDSYAQPEYVPWERQSRPKHSAPHFLLVVPWMEMGGADRFNLDLLRGLSQRGYRISLLTTQKAENAWLDHVLQLTPNVFCLADFLSPDRFAAFFSYFIQSRGVDVMMVSNSPEGYCLLPWLEQHFPRLPVVDYVHMPEPAWRSGGHARQSGMLSGFLRKTYTCNEHSRRQLIEQYHHREDKVKTVYIGVDAARFDPCKTQVGQVYETLGIEKSRPVVLFPCRLSAQKRPFFMLEMATRLAKSPLRPAFVVVGEGPLLKELERAVRERNAQDTVFLPGNRRTSAPGTATRH